MKFETFFEKQYNQLEGSHNNKQPIAKSNAGTTSIAENQYDQT